MLACPTSAYAGRGRSTVAHSSELARAPVFSMEFRLCPAPPTRPPKRSEEGGGLPKVGLFHIEEEGHEDVDLWGWALENDAVPC